jgi:hypothetical protein
MLLNGAMEENMFAATIERKAIFTVSGTSVMG